ncbi:MAG: DMT family transporter [Thaumarchaeota archaeon]|nr:DMT family transporter [Nitrososphaerota archaeon]
MKKLSAYLHIGLASILWGSNGVIVNLVELHPTTITFFRVLIGGLTLIIVSILVKGLETFKVNGFFKRLVILGALLAAGWYFLFQAMKLIPIGAAVLINYLAPVFVAVLAPSVLDERLEKKIVIAIVLSILGVFLISCQGLGSGELSILGIIFGLLAATSYGGFVIYSKQTLAKLSYYTVAMYSYLVSALILSPSLLLIKSPLSLNSFILLFLMGVLNTGVAVTLYLKGLRSLKAQEAATITYLEPLSAIIFGYFMLGQEISIGIILGGALILTSQYLVIK